MPASSDRLCLASAAVPPTVEGGRLPVAMKPRSPHAPRLGHLLLLACALGACAYVLKARRWAGAACSSAAARRLFARASPSPSAGGRRPQSGTPSASAAALCSLPQQAQVQVSTFGTAAVQSGRQEAAGRSAAAAAAQLPQAPPALAPASPLSCGIYNNVNHHLDVAAGLAWALQV